MGKIGITINGLILVGVFLAILYHRGNTNYERWKNAPAAIHTMLPKEPRFAFHQIQGGQSTLDKPAHSVTLTADSAEAQLILQTLESLRITPMAGLSNTQRNVGDITLKHQADGSQQRYAFHAIEIDAWPSAEPLPEGAPPFFKLTVVNDHWAILTIASQEIMRGRLSNPIAEALAPLHHPEINHYIESAEPK